jgi:hypothetical protein
MNSGALVRHGTVSEVLQKPDILEGAGVNIPRVTTLGYKLRELGLYSGELPHDLAEAQVMMEKILEAKGAV